jgi:TonB family protein
MVTRERIFELDPVPENHCAAPRLLVPWPSRAAVFFSNFRDLMFPRREPLLLTSAPGIFWKDVFVHRPFPLRFILDSYALHALVVLAVYFVFSSPLFFAKPLPTRNPFANSTIEYYSVSEYLPSITSKPKPSAHAVKGAPAYAKQEIISVPPEPDNSRQTIVTPDLKILAKDVRLPNMMAWADRPEPIQPLSASLNPHPKLFTPPDIIAPPPEELPRLRPDLKFQQTVVIKPSPEDVPNSHRRLPTLEADVVRPAPDIAAGTKLRSIAPIQPSVIEPPPTPDALRRLPGAMNVGKLSPVPSQPRLPVAEQRASTGQAGGAGGGAQPQTGSATAPPPPSSQGLGSGRASGQLIALSAQPAPVLGPIEVPRGSRRGLFAAGPTGTIGAPGTPDFASGPKEDVGDNKGSPSVNGNNGPEGIYVGPGPNAPSGGGAVVAASPQPAPPTPEPTFRERLMNAMRSVTTDVPHPPAPGNTPPPPRSESRIEDKVFGDRKYYSMILNMPNLNSSSGSWIIRFAELIPTKDQTALSAPVAMNKVDPAYPPDLIRDQVEGTVVLYAVIRANGTVDSVRVLSSVEGRLDRSAVRALQHWHFRPGTKQGLPVDIEAVVQIPFRVAKLKW